MLKTALFTAGLAVPSLFGAGVTINAPFSTSYSLVDLGPAPGVSSNYGGLVVSQTDPLQLLIGGAANTGGAVIDSVGLIRDASNHITGFTNATTQFATAPQIDGGLTYAPNGDLLFTEYPNNAVGQIKPGSTSPDKTVAAPTGGSVGTLQFVPAGYTGAGNLVIGSYSTGQFCNATASADAFGTYDISACGNSTNIGSSAGPEGFIYVPLGSANFAAQSVLISEYGSGAVGAYSIDADGLPILASRQDFITGLFGAEGAAIDPLTGDFLFSTFGGGNHVFAVQGFAPATPEPGTMALLGSALIGVSAVRRRSLRR